MLKRSKNFSMLVIYLPESGRALVSQQATRIGAKRADSATNGASFAASAW